MFKVIKVTKGTKQNEKDEVVKCVEFEEAKSLAQHLEILIKKKNSCLIFTHQAQAL